MQPYAEFEPRLDRVTERVSVIEEGAQSDFPLVQRNNLGFIAARAMNRIDEGFRLARHEPIDILL